MESFVDNAAIVYHIVCQSTLTVERYENEEHGESSSCAYQINAVRLDVVVNKLGEVQR